MRPRPGFALATILILLGVALFGVGALVTISTLESKISRSQQEGVTAYNVAEAGTEDALWRLNNTPSYINALRDGNLNVTYTATNIPAAGQSFNAHLYTDSAKGAGFGIIDITGLSDASTFIAQRKIMAWVFQGVVGGPSPTGTKAFLAGGAASVTNSSTSVKVIGGDFFANGAVSFNLSGNGKVDVGTNNIYAGTTYSTNSPGNVIAAGTFSNTPTVSLPGLDFNYYRTNNNASYNLSNSASNSAFRAAITSAAGLVGPVTYVEGNIMFNSWARDKVAKIHGMLIVNGSITFNATDFDLFVYDPGSGKAGIFANGNLSILRGEFSLDGILYATGSVSVNNTETMAINGAFIAGGLVSLNSGVQFTLTYVPSRVSASFDTGSSYTAEIQHWEEEY